MMLEWAARGAVDFEFLPTVTNVGRGVQNLEFAVAADAHGIGGARESRSERRCRQLAGASVGSLATTADATRSHDRRQKAQPLAYDHLSGKVLSPGSSTWRRAAGVLCVSLREDAEEQAG